MAKKFKLTRWLWRNLPQSFIISTFRAMPHFLVRYIGPVEVTLEPTNACNLRCPLCPRQKLSRAYGSMKLEHFKKIIDGFPWSVRVIELYFMGEPLLAPDLFKMISYARSKGLVVRISTNATYLKQYTSQILDSDLSEMILSVDGASAETYKQYRVGGDFNKVIDGIEHFMKEKRKRKAKNPSAVMQFIIMKHNEHEIEDIKKLAKKLDVDHLVFKKASLMDTMRDSATQKQLGKKFLPSQVKNLRKLFTTKKIDACRWAFSAQVTQDGNVTSCCYDWDGKLIKGNAISHSFKNIFRSKEYTAMRKDAIAQKLSICKNCDYNNEISEKIF